jgi:hypothetical protein
MAGTTREKGSTSEMGISVIGVPISAVEPGTPAAEGGAWPGKMGSRARGWGEIKYEK